jgi:hypothetical protein
MAKENTEITVNTTYEVEGETLKVIETPVDIQPTITTYNIAEIQNEIDKINGAISSWEEKKAPLQAIIDLYNKNK